MSDLCRWICGTRGGADCGGERCGRWPALSVAPSSVVKWTQRLRATGSSRLARLAPLCPKIAGTHRAWLGRADGGAFTCADCGRTCGRGLRVDYRTAGHSSAAIGLSFKKTGLAASKTIPASPAGGRWKTARAA